MYTYRGRDLDGTYQELYRLLNGLLFRHRMALVQSQLLEAIEEKVRHLDTWRHDLASLDVSQNLDSIVDEWLKRDLQTVLVEALKLAEDFYEHFEKQSLDGYGSQFCDYFRITLT
jgi:hypothetical protein